MGFRSSWTMQHYDVNWSQKFQDKYRDSINFNDTCISPKFEAKACSAWENLITDIQAEVFLNNSLPLENIIFVWLHECGGITRVQISKDSILYSEPNDWRTSDGIEHDYCYGCSDIVENFKE
jgi:hypothetical protein